jgi:LuxR family maltose regulon positive regulatory protein
VRPASGGDVRVSYVHGGIRRGIRSGHRCLLDVQPDGGASRSTTYHLVVTVPLLATKLYVPPSRRRVVLRPRLIERLNEGLAAGHKVTLVSAPAGFGKSTMVAEWVAGCGRPVAWLSLDEGDSDLSRFLTYLIAALQTVAPGIGDGVLTALWSPQPPPPESTLTALLNDVTTIPSDVVLVLDDYHVLDARPVDDALATGLASRTW